MKKSLQGIAFILSFTFTTSLYSQGQISIDVQQAICDPLGSIVVSASQGSSPSEEYTLEYYPITTSSSTVRNVTTVYFTSTYQIRNLAPGRYGVIITNEDGCKQEQEVEIKHNATSTASLKNAIAITATNHNCGEEAGGKDGSINVTIEVNNFSWSLGFNTALGTKPKLLLYKESVSNDRLTATYEFTGNYNSVRSVNFEKLESGRYYVVLALTNTCSVVFDNDKYGAMIKVNEIIGDFSWKSTVDYFCSPYFRSYINLEAADPRIVFTWSDGITGAFRANLADGAYTVTATMGGQCKKTETYIVSDPIRSSNLYTVKYNCNTKQNVLEIIDTSSTNKYFLNSWFNPIVGKTVVLPQETQQLFIRIGDSCEISRQIDPPSRGGDLFTEEIDVCGPEKIIKILTEYPFTLSSTQSNVRIEGLTAYVKNNPPAASIKISLDNCVFLNTYNFENTPAQLTTTPSCFGTKGSIVDPLYNVVSHHIYKIKTTDLDPGKYNYTQLIGNKYQCFVGEVKDGNFDVNAIIKQVLGADGLVKEYVVEIVPLPKDPNLKLIDFSVRWINAVTSFEDAQKQDRFMLTFKPGEKWN